MPWIEFDEKLLHAESGRFFIRDSWEKHVGMFEYYIQFQEGGFVLTEIFATVESADARWEQLKILLRVNTYSSKEDEIEALLNRVVSLRREGR